MRRIVTLLVSLWREALTFNQNHLSIWPKPEVVRLAVPESVAAIVYCLSELNRFPQRFSWLYLTTLDSISQRKAVDELSKHPNRLPFSNDLTNELRGESCSRLEPLILLLNGTLPYEGL